jgi:hypothetical protein
LAEEALLKVQRELALREMGYDAALVSMDLGTLYLETGAVEALRNLAGELVPICGRLTAASRLHGHGQYPVASKSMSIISVSWVSRKYVSHQSQLSVLNQLLDLRALWGG